MTIIQPETARERQAEVTEKIFDCDKRNLEMVEELLNEIEQLVEYHSETSKKAYSVTQQDSDCGAAAVEAALSESMSPRGLAALQKSVSPFLVSLLSRPPRNCPDESLFMDRVSNLMASVCGRISQGESSTSFEFPNTGSLLIRETSFTEAEIGFQTWGAGILLGKMIDEGSIRVCGQDILELGSGTGLAGLVSGKMGARTIMTDYHPVVIENAKRNIAVNNLEDMVKCLELDWRWFLDLSKLKEKEDPVLSQTEWRTIIAADCVFDLSHSALVPKVAMHYLSKHADARFHVLLPHRLQFKREIDAFQENMLKEGWICEYDHWIEKHSLTLRYYIYRLPNQESE